MSCVGCASGCSSCNATDQSICLVCNLGLLLYNGGCGTSCPKGWITNFQGTQCIDLGNTDVKLVYFPFLMLIILIALVNFISRWIKPKHQIISNFIIMMGVLEHAFLICQVALCFGLQGSLIFGILSIVIWFVYIGC